MGPQEQLLEFLQKQQTESNFRQERQQHLQQQSQQPQPPPSQQQIEQLQGLQLLKQAATWKQSQQEVGLQGQLAGQQLAKLQTHMSAPFPFVQQSSQQQSAQMLFQSLASPRAAAQLPSATVLSSQGGVVIPSNSHLSAAASPATALASQPAPPAATVLSPTALRLGPPRGLAKPVPWSESFDAEPGQHGARRAAEGRGPYPGLGLGLRNMKDFAHRGFSLPERLLTSTTTATATSPKPDQGSASFKWLKNAGGAGGPPSLGDAIRQLQMQAAALAAAEGRGGRKGGDGAPAAGSFLGTIRPSPIRLSPNSPFALLGGAKESAGGLSSPAAARPGGEAPGKVSPSGRDSPGLRLGTPGRDRDMQHPRLPHSPAEGGDAAPGSAPVSPLSCKRQREDMDLDLELDGAFLSLASSDDEVANGLVASKKLKLSWRQTEALEAAFLEASSLTEDQKARLAKDLGLHVSQVDLWLQSRVTGPKKKQAEADVSALKKRCAMLADDNFQLRKELLELKDARRQEKAARKLPVAAATLAMCPQCAEHRTLEKRAVEFFGRPAASLSG